jgi:phenylalanyl-tRNA synthetase beta chain
MNYSLVSGELLDLFGIDDAGERIVLPHPISTEQSILRTSLLPQMVESLGHNRARQVREAAFFEMGRVFRGADGATAEEERVSLGLMGPVGRPVMEKQSDPEPAEPFFWLKGIVEALLEGQGVTDWTFEPWESPCFEAGHAAAIRIAGEPAGVMGLVTGHIRDEWRLSDPVAVAELSLAPLLEHVFELHEITPIPAFPAVQRDMALVVDRDVKHRDILEIINKSAPSELESVELFDIFEGEAIGPGRKSMAYSLTYRSSERTLTDEDANRYHEAVKKSLREALKLDIRES